MNGTRVRLASAVQSGVMGQVWSEDYRIYCKRSLLGSGRSRSKVCLPWRDCPHASLEIRDDADLAIHGFRDTGQQYRQLVLIFTEPNHSFPTNPGPVPTRGQGPPPRVLMASGSELFRAGKSRSPVNIISSIDVSAPRQKPLERRWRRRVGRRAGSACFFAVCRTGIS